MFGRSRQRIADVEVKAQRLAVRVEGLEAQVNELTGLLEAMKEAVEGFGQVDHIAMEWESWYEKFKTLYARLNRRVERDAKKAEPEAEENGVGKVQNPAALALLQQGRVG